MAISPGEPDSTDQVLPDGWIRTPIPAARRVRRDKESWFGRTGEPAPSRVPVAPPIPADDEVRKLSQGVIWGAFLLVCLFGVLIVGGVGWWFA